MNQRLLISVLLALIVVAYGFPLYEQINEFPTKKNCKSQPVVLHDDDLDALHTFMGVFTRLMRNRSNIGQLNTQAGTGNKSETPCGCNSDGDNSGATGPNGNSGDNNGLTTSSSTSTSSLLASNDDPTTTTTTTKAATTTTTTTTTPAPTTTTTTITPVIPFIPASSAFPVSLNEANPPNPASTGINNDRFLSNLPVSPNNSPSTFDLVNGPPMSIHPLLLLALMQNAGLGNIINKNNNVPFQDSGLSNNAIIIADPVVNTTAPPTTTTTTTTSTTTTSTARPTPLTNVIYRMGYIEGQPRKRICFKTFCVKLQDDRSDGY